MSNMSYCRFENTSIDLKDCLNVMEESESLEEMDLSKSESRSFKEMYEQAQQFVCEYERLNGIEDEDDNDE